MSAVTSRRPSRARVRRLRRTLAVVITLTAAGLVTLAAEVQPTTSGPVATVHQAMPSGHETPVEPSQPPAVPPIRRVVSLGDSVSAGSACNCLPFADLVAHDIASDQGHPVTVTNLSVGGATASDLLQQLNERATQQALRTADVVLVTTGANDLEAQSSGGGCANLDPGCFRSAVSALPATMNQVLARIRSAVPAQAVVVTTGYWNVFLDGAVARSNGSTYVTNSKTLTQTVNDVIESSARQNGALYLDTYSLFKGDNDSDDTALLAADGDHPNAAGHRVIANGVVGLLRAAGCGC